jgi:hypothetical protein
MGKAARPDSKHIRRRVLRALGAGLAVATLVAATAPSRAGWLSKVVDVAEHAGTTAAGRGLRALDGAARHIKSLPPRAEGGAVLAAQATQEGHWRFINQAGETFTAGTPEELRRAGSVLLPQAKGNQHLVLYVTEDTIFSYRAALKELPKGTELHVVVGSDSYRLLRHGEGAEEHLFAQVRPGLVVRMSDAKAFAEAMWQLARPLNKANVRVLALEPGGPPALSAAPRVDPASRRAMIDVIDPASLAVAMRAVRGQTLLVTGRAQGGKLYVQPTRGAEVSLSVRDLFKAAEDADVNLVMLEAASTPRQPGGRNWFWQKVQVKGLDEALERARLADFLNALAGPGRRLEATATPSGRLRVTLDLHPIDLPAAIGSRPLSDVFSDMASDVTGNIVVSAVRANVQSAERQQELDLRLIPGVPYQLQAGYLVLLVLGLIGVPMSRAWWQRVWPPESTAEYAGRLGYWLARLVRGTVFLAIFLPVTAPVSAPLALLKQVWDTVTAPVRAWRWLAARLNSRRPSRKVGATPTPLAGTGDWPQLDASAAANRVPNR